MRFGLRRIFLVTTILACVLGLYCWSPLDGRIEAIRACFSKDSTVYAPGYSDSAFRKVRVGMVRAEVYSLLGQPLWRQQSKIGTTKGWTKCRGNPPFRVRVIEFEDDAVESTYAAFERQFRLATIEAGL